MNFFYCLGFYYFNELTKTFSFSRISFPKEIFVIVACHYLFSTCYCLSSCISYYLGFWGLHMECSQCLVGKANWFYDVRTIFPFKFLNLLFPLHELTYCLLFCCFCRVQSWKSPSVIYFLVVQILAVFVALVDIYVSNFGLDPWRHSCWGHFLTVVEHLGL